MPEGRIAAQSFLENEPQAYMRLQQVSDLIFGYETPYGMELLATVHWVGTKEVNPARDSDTPEESLCDRYYIKDKRYKQQATPSKQWQHKKSRLNYYKPFFNNWLVLLRRWYFER